MKTIVNDIRTVNSLIKAGLVIPCNQTGSKISGLYSSKTFTCCYVDDHGNQGSRFEHKGVKYSVEYVDGCFNPYVFRID